jgi:hypothetical protein
MSFGIASVTKESVCFQQVSAFTDKLQKGKRCLHKNLTRCFFIEGTIAETEGGFSL